MTAHLVGQLVALPVGHRVLGRRWLPGIAEEPHPPLGARPGDAVLVEDLDARRARVAAVAAATRRAVAHDARMGRLVVRLHAERLGFDVSVGGAA